EFAFALAAAAHIETKNDVAELAEHLGWLHRIRRSLVAAEPVRHDEGGTPLARPHPARDMHDPRQLESGGWKGDSLFGHQNGLRGGRKRRATFFHLTRGGRGGRRSFSACGGGGVGGFFPPLPAPRRSSRKMQEPACSDPPGRNFRET